jgi:pSer/pThr/pTyr-binding forkhead associated (FHA) protein
LHVIDSGETIPLEGGHEFTLGRVTKGQPLIPEVDLSAYSAYEKGVSRLHAVIAVRQGRVTVTDLGSANGTRVNRERISAHIPHPLRHGDLLTLGTLKIQTIIQL